MTPAPFAELDRARTPMGELVLRRRHDPALGVDLYEVKLGDEFLMSSLYTAAEEALADLGLAAAAGGGLDVVVGGLGLGYTARAVLAHPTVRSLHVVEVLPEVIGWHRRGLVPLGAELLADGRCRLVRADFFATFAGAAPVREPAAGPSAPRPHPDEPAPGPAPPWSGAERFHAILLDVDHSPSKLLAARHGAAYEPRGLEHLAARLHPGGCLAIWSDDPPDEGFVEALAGPFTSVRAHTVAFPNLHTGGEAANTVYVARLDGAPARPG